MPSPAIDLCGLYFIILDCSKEQLVTFAAFASMSFKWFF